MDIKLRILTPKGVYLSEETDIITVKTSEGYIGIQYGINSFVSSLVPSKMFVGSSKKSNQKILYIGSGMIHAEKDYVDVITDEVSDDPALLLEIMSSMESTKNKDLTTEDFAQELKVKKSLKNK